MIEDSKVLIVDDNEEIVEVLSDFLMTHGCATYKASTGREALQILEGTEIGIVILDVKLPDVSGVSLLSTIKIKDPTIAVIMITGYHDPSLIVEAMKKGASDFLIKPFDFDRFMLVMMRVARERNLLVEKKTILDSLEDKRKIELLNTELQERIQELSTMYHITNRFNSLNILDDVYDRMLQIIYEVLDIKNCGYYIVDGESNELMLYKALRNGNEGLLRRNLIIPDDLLKEGLSTKRYLEKDDQIFLPLLIRGEYIGFVVLDAKDRFGRKKNTFSESDAFFLRLITEKAATQIENKMLYESLFEGVLQTLTSLISAVNKRDSYTDNHCRRVTRMSVELGEKLGLAGYERDVLSVVGPIHDLGKVGVPDAILLKPGKLNEDEYSVIKAHSVYGEEIMNRFEILVNEAKIIRHHHERFDGKGYPDGLAGDSIPLCSRVIAVCDTYDAMVSNRPYRKAMSNKEAVEEILRCRGSQFDPVIVDCFVDTVAHG